MMSMMGMFQIIMEMLVMTNILECTTSYSQIMHCDINLIINHDYYLISQYFLHQACTQSTCMNLLFREELLQTYCLLEPNYARNFLAFTHTFQYFVRRQKYGRTYKWNKLVSHKRWGRVHVENTNISFLSSPPQMWKDLVCILSLHI